MVKTMNRYFVALLLGLCVQDLCAQQGLLQQISLDDTYRRQQLLGDTIRQSFLLVPYQYRFVGMQSVAKKDSILVKSSIGYALQNNSALPYSYNAETFVPATGFQQRFTAGVQMESKHISIRFQPEWVGVTNRVNNDLIPPSSNTLNNYWGKFFAMIGNRIDMPSRFGDSSFTKFYLGQSSLRFKTEQFAIGVSNENLWWGPSRFNALVMSNNAPGFLHVGINTMKPLVTPIGKLEAQLVYGTLKGSGVTPPEFERIAQLGCPQCYEAPPNNKDRTITGYVLSFSPKGMDNLFIGMSYASYRYSDSNARASSLGSMFFRYVMPKDKAEIYAEYGRSDKHISPFDLVRDSVPRGYTIGFRKLISLRKKDQYLSISTEITHLGLPKAEMIFDRNNIFGGPNPNSYSWYTSSSIRHGYTNDGRVIGAAIGPGSNSQTFNLTWHQRQNQIGLQLQRVMRNTDFYYYNYFSGTIGLGNTAAFWVDISASLFAQWQFKQLMIAGSIDRLSSINYKWLKLDGDFGSPSTLSDKKNFQIRLSMRYDIEW